MAITRRYVDYFQRWSIVLGNGSYLILSVELSITKNDTPLHSGLLVLRYGCCATIANEQEALPGQGFKGECNLQLQIRLDWQER